MTRQPSTRTAEPRTAADAVRRGLEAIRDTSIDSASRRLADSLLHAIEAEAAAPAGLDVNVLADLVTRWDSWAGRLDVDLMDGGVGSTGVNAARSAALHECAAELRTAIARLLQGKRDD